MRWIKFSKKEPLSSQLVQTWIMLVLILISTSILIISMNGGNEFLNRPDIFWTRIILTLALSCSIVRFARLVTKLYYRESEE